MNKWTGLRRALVQITDEDGCVVGWSLNVVGAGAATQLHFPLRIRRALARATVPVFGVDDCVKEWLVNVTPLATPADPLDSDTDTRGMMPIRDEDGCVTAWAVNVTVVEPEECEDTGELVVPVYGADDCVIGWAVKVHTTLDE